MSKWPAFPLEELVEGFLDGDWIEKKDQSSKGIRLLQTGNVGLGVFRSNDRKARFIDDATFDRLKCEEVRPGDVLVSRLPDPIGRACIIPELDGRLITAVDCTIIRFKEQLMREFFIHYSLSPQYLRDVQQQATGTTRQRISRARLGKINIPLPPLDEQKRIVAKLDKVQRLSAEIARRHDENRRLIETHVDISIEQEFSTLDCPKRPISEVTEQIIDHRGKTPGKLGGEFTLQGVPVISAIHVKEGVIHWARRARFVSVDMFKRWMKEPLRRGDVLLTSEAPLGEVAFVPNDDPLVLSQRLFALRGDPRSVDSEFLGFYLQSIGGQRQLQGRKTGATVSGIKQSELAKVLVPIPSLIKQREIVVRINQVKRLTRIMRKNQAERASMLSSLTHSLTAATLAGDF